MYNPMSEMFRCLAMSIVFMFVGYFVGFNFLPASFVYMANILLGILMLALIVMSIFSRKNVIPRRFSMNYVYLFTFVDGIVMSPVITYYVGTLGSSTVLGVLLASAMLFGTLSYIANKSNDYKFLKMGPALFAGMIALLVANAFNMFIYGRTMNLIVSFAGLVIFSMYILYDVSLLRAEIEHGQIQDRDDLSIHVLNVYIDFINIFMDILRIVKELRD